MTRTDKDGKRYFRVPPHWQWQRLKAPMDFAKLNKALAKSRPPAIHAKLEA